MNQTKKIILLSAVLVGLIALTAVFFYLIKSQLSPSSPDNVNSLAGQPINVEISPAGDSNVSGTATLIPAGNQVKVSLSLSGTPQDAVEPAHIHAGTCANPGWIKYPLSYPQNGKSETVLDASMEDLTASLPLIVDVHDSAEQMKTFSACGEIK